MTSYRGMDGQAGRPGNGPAGATAISANYVPGTLFKVTRGGCWFEGYWLWCCASGGQPLTATKFALWNMAKGPTATGTVVPGTKVTSGPLSNVPGPGEAGGHWNYVPLPAPVPIAINTTYTPAAGINGPFPDVASQFGVGQPYAAGIVNGPLVLFSDAGAGLPDPYGNPQGIFSSFAGGDPGTQIPTQGNSSSNLWMDVQVRDTDPPGYAGPFEPWPNKFDADLFATAGTDAAQKFSLATEFWVSAPVLMQAVRFFSPNPAPGGLPTWCGIWRISDRAIVAQNAAPAWVQPDGVTPAVAGGGRCHAALSGLLAPGKYKAACYNENGLSGGWSPYNYGYWLNGGGGNGIRWGPLYFPKQAEATPALIFNGGGASEPSQGSFAFSGSNTYPDTAVDFNVSGPPGAIAESFWVAPVASLAPATSGITFAIGAM